MNDRATSNIPTRIPNFRGLRVLILHPHDHNCNAIVEQLGRLGASANICWPAERVLADAADIVFFDVDRGFEGMFGWPTGKAPVPLIAILGSEAPGRIEWMLAQAPSAYLAKPIGSTGVFSALAIATHNFASHSAREAAYQRLEERLQMRGVLLRATIELMRRHNIDEETALSMLRAESMRRRATLETVGCWVLEGGWLRANTGPPLTACRKTERRAGSG
ncbi:MAG TPA: ANTAR domain-containing protein [Gemmataceae bacterium]|nr:ANTAR domain-containing protein [Gemmataceae bacterium]